jgi:hypothetical protein
MYGPRYRQMHKLFGRLVKVVALDAEVLQIASYLLPKFPGGCNYNLSQCNPTSTMVAKVVAATIWCRSQNGFCYVEGSCLTALCGSTPIEKSGAGEGGNSARSSLSSYLNYTFLWNYLRDIVVRLCPMCNRALVGTDRFVEGMVCGYGATCHLSVSSRNITSNIIFCFMVFFIIDLIVITCFFVDVKFLHCVHETTFICNM